MHHVKGKGQVAEGFTHQGRKAVGGAARGCQHDNEGKNCDEARKFEQTIRG